MNSKIKIILIELKKKKIKKIRLKSVWQCVHVLHYIIEHRASLLLALDGLLVAAVGALARTGITLETNITHDHII